MNDALFRAFAFVIASLIVGVGVDAVLSAIDLHGDSDGELDAYFFEEDA